MTKKILLGLGITGILVSQAGAKSYDDAGEAAEVFLKLGCGARAIAMGEAYGAVAEDATAIHWNPAGLADLSAREATFMYNEYLEGIRYGHVGYIPVMTQDGAIGIAVTHLGTNIDGRIEDDSPYPYHAADTCISTGYGYKIREDIYLGGALKGIFSQIADSQSAGAAIDAGLLYKPEIEGLTLGLSLHNIGPGIKFEDKTEDLPFNVKLSSAYRANTDRLLIAVDLNKPVDNDILVNAGVEFWPVPLFALRAGYNSRLDAGEKYSIGLGFRLNNFDVDCAYVPYDDFNDTYQISFSTKF